MGIDNTINKKAPNLIEQEMIEKNTAQNESKLLPKIEVLDNNSDDKKREENLEENKENKLDDENNNKENLDANNNEENNENK